MKPLTKALVVFGAATAVVLTLGWFGLMAIGLARPPFDRVPSPDDADVVAARRAASRELTRFATETTSAVLPASPTPRWSATGHDCVEGQHNWKIDDPYDLRCTLVVIQIAGDRPVASWREDAVALHQALLDEGWRTSTALHLGRVITEYWDSRADIDATYGPADLPEARYELADLDEQLVVRFLEPGQGLVLTTAEGSRAHHDAILAEADQIAPDSYAVLFEYTRVYFAE